MADRVTLKTVLNAVVDLRSKMDEGFADAKAERDAIRREMHSHFDVIYKRLERLEIEYHMLVEAVKRIEANFADMKIERIEIRRRIEVLEAEVARLKEQLSEMDSESHDA